MKKSIYSLIILVSLSLSAFAQDNKKVALTIGEQPIYKEDLVKAFNDKGGMLENGQKETIDDFLKGYILNELLFREAQSQRIDTIAAYTHEFYAYKTQLSIALLTDTISSRKMAEEILERFEYELDVKQVFIPFGKALHLPSDTLSFYQKAMKARKVAVKDGFDKVEVENETNSFGVIMDVEQENGNVGWIRPFMFSFNLEKVIYSLPMDEVSMPIRSTKGYHVLQVVGKRPAQANPIIEQVLFNFPIIPATKRIQDSVYNVAIRTYDEISIRDNFQLICDEFALAFNRGEQGCLFGEIRIDEQIPSSLVRAAFEMKEVGDVSEPILSDYGYHIFRLKDKRSLPSKEVRQKSILAFLNNPKVLTELMARQRERMMETNDAKVNYKAYNEVAKLTAKFNPLDSIFESQVKNTSDVIITIDNKKKYKVSDFLDYIALTAWMYLSSEQDEERPDVRVEVIAKPTMSTDILKMQMDGFVYLVLSNYEKEVLADRNPVFAKTIDNLSRDLMVTTFMDREVWRKAKVDVKGLENTFAKNQSKYQLDGETYKGVIIQAKTQDILSQAEAAYKNGATTSRALRSLFNKDDAAVIQVEEGTWRKGDDQFVDTKIFKSKDRQAQRNFPFYSVVGKFITSPQDYRDVKTQVEQDYQQELEKNLSSSLREKYNVEINDAIIKTIK